MPKIEIGEKKRIRNKEYRIKSMAQIKRGIISHGAYIPSWRLDRGEIDAALSQIPVSEKDPSTKKLLTGTGATKGERRIAGFDEDTTTMGVAAARNALAPYKTQKKFKNSIRELWFSTAEPAYLEKTNASIIHAVLQLPTTTSALDFGGAARSGIGALRSAINLQSASNSNSKSKNLVVLSGLRIGMSGSPDESRGGDGAAAFVMGTGEGVIAEYIGKGSATQEFIDRWREPTQRFTQQWEERFAEQAYGPLFSIALRDALGTKLQIQDIDSAAVIGTHPRSTAKIAKQFERMQLADDLIDTVGNTGAAHPGVVLSAMLEKAKPNKTLAVVWLADGVEILIFKTTEALSKYKSAKPLSVQMENARSVNYNTYLRWRKLIPTQTPNRPEPVRISAPASYRTSSWKHALAGRNSVKDIEKGEGIQFDKEIIEKIINDEETLTDFKAKIVTFTIDHLVYSENKPTIFAVIDFIDDTKTRFALELTDVAENEVEVGMEVEMTFRKIHTADGIHNYFYKARPIGTKKK